MKTALHRAGNWLVLHTYWLDPILLRVMLTVMPWRSIWDGRCLMWTMDKVGDQEYRVVFDWIDLAGRPSTLTISGDPLELGTFIPALEVTMLRMGGHDES